MNEWGFSKRVVSENSSSFIQKPYTRSSKVEILALHKFLRKFLWRFWVKSEKVTKFVAFKSFLKHSLWEVCRSYGCAFLIPAGQITSKMWFSSHYLPCHSSTVVPQLSKCLKFEAVWGVLTDQMIWSWTKSYNKTHACIVVHRMTRHNHLIDWYYLLSSFV